MSTPSPTCLVNNLAPPQSVTASSTVTIALASLVGVESWQILCYGTDELNSISAIQAQLNTNLNSANQTTSFTMPGAGSSIVLRSTVFDNNNNSFTTTFKVRCLTTTGYRVGALNETIEDDPSGFGNLTMFNQGLRGGFTNPTGPAGGDLGGTYPNPSVIKIQSNPIKVQTLGASQDGYALTWVNADAEWEAKPILAEIAHGTAGQVLMTNATPATTWTTLSGDVTVNATGVTTVNSVSGSTPVNITPVTLQWLATTVLPTLKQAAPTSDVATTNLTLSPQAPYASASTNKTPGNLIVNLPAPLAGGNEAFFQIQRNGNTLASIGGWASDGVNYGGLYFSGSVSNVTPGAGNYTLLAHTTDTLYINSGSTIYMNLGGAGGSSPYLQLSSATVGLGQATLQFQNTVTSPAFNHQAQAPTSSGSGAVGQTLAITSQAGQAATGATHNGGNGGPLNLASGAGGTSGSATAGTNGLVNLQPGGTTVLSVGPNANGTNAVITSGVVQLPIRAIAASYTVDTTGPDYTLLVDTTSARTITLPAPTVGRVIVIKDSTGNAGANNITIARHASENIEGVAASYVFVTNWGKICLQSDGTNWYKLT